MTFPNDGDQSLRDHKQVPKSNEPNTFQGLGGPMTRARTKKIKEALQQAMIILFKEKPNMDEERSKMVNCIQEIEE